MKSLFQFGARSSTISALPGEFVPDRLLKSLKTLADPSRPKIFYYISQEQVTHPGWHDGCICPPRPSPIP